MTLTADKIEEGTEEYENYVNAVKDEFTVDEGKSLQFTPYDVYFLYDGNKIEPEDEKVQVRMSFKKDMFDSDAEQEEDTELFVAHIKNDGDIERVENSSKDENTVEFEVSSFSVMGPVSVSANDEKAYAIIYDTGNREGGYHNPAYIISIQRGNAVDSSYGTVKVTYEDIEAKDFSADNWYDDTGWDVEIIVQDKIYPKTMENWFSVRSLVGS